MVSQLPLYGLLAGTPTVLVAASVLALIAIAGFCGAAVWIWTLGAAAVAWATGATWAWWILVPVALVANVRPLRRLLLTDRILAFMQKSGMLPTISETERTAIEAGNVWVDGELFSGKPDLVHLNNAPLPELTAAEEEFLDGPVETACAMADDFQIWEDRDLPDEIWEYLKHERFFGMIIPKEYGGLGFSANAHSAVIQKLASRSLPIAITVMVPNSLGPAELLIHYGTTEQQQHYLPRLASGEDIPCFALTEPCAGSDAGAMQARGIVFRGDDGELYLRLSWDKRYITLAAISTVLGLAFKLEDPEDLLGKGKRPGITCALIPSSAEGVELGRRHDPLGVPFYNCPTSGEDVVVPASAIIGGRDGAGQGWRMLMECLAAGRGISLPATSTGGAKLVARVVGAYASVRKQFGLPIGKFEGIEEPLARIGGLTWLLDAARLYTAGGIDGGMKPPVVTAMAKYQFTELFRGIINDGMDVLGGAAISRGPNNLLAHAYTGAPISITVEGANILTRTLMVFGQGAIRCHPYVFHEIEASAKNDKVAFDRAFWNHVGHVARNTFRSVLLSVTRGRLAKSPVRGPAAPYWRRLSWASASFALYADLAMAGLGGSLKRKEKITGRFADIFSWLYLATAGLRRFEADGRRAEDVPFLRWSMEHAFAQIQRAFDGLLQNLTLPGATWLVRGPVSMWSRVNPMGRGPDDRTGARVARALLEPTSVRDGVTRGIFLGGDEASGLGRLERAFRLCVEADAIAKKIKDAIRAKKLQKGPIELLIDDARDAGVITADEVELLRCAEESRAAAIAVDSFALDEYLKPRSMPETADA